MATSSTQSEFLFPSIWSSVAAQDALLPIRLAKGGFDGGLDESDSVSDSGKGVCKAALIGLCREAGGGIRADSIALPWLATLPEVSGLYFFVILLRALNCHVFHVGFFFILF